MQYALVTGGSRGIGRAVCLKLAKMGYTVLINYNTNTAAAEQTKSLIRAAGGGSCSPEAAVGASFGASAHLSFPYSR